MSRQMTANVAGIYDKALELSVALLARREAEIERLTVRWAGVLPTEPGTYFMRSAYIPSNFAAYRFHEPFVERDVAAYARAGWEFSTRIPEPLELEAK